MSNGPFYPQGGYRGTITQQGFTEAKTGTTQFFLQVQIDAYDNGDPVERSYQRTIFRAITPNTVDYFKEDMEAIGYQWRGSFAYLDPANGDHDSLVGGQVALWCKHEAGTNGTQERWQISRPPSKFEGKPVAANKMRELDRMFGKAMGGGNSTATQPRPAAVPAGGITDEDVPF